MAEKLKVDELRSQLAQRRLSTRGNKSAMVKRLDSAIAKDSKNSISHKLTGNKRACDSQNGCTTKCYKSTETSANPSGGVPVETQESCMGEVALDQWLPDHIKNQYHVLQHQGEAYDAMLNQTNIGDNNNKFYVIQVLENSDRDGYLVYTRWGRVGARGQDNIVGPFKTRDAAIMEFTQKFKAKTKNDWDDKKNFTCNPRSYVWLEMDYRKNKKFAFENPYSAAVQLSKTRLEPRIAKFISLICNVNMMKQKMMEIGYNAEKLPLDKLSKSTILKGYEVLKRIADVIEMSERKILEQLSGQFYTIIPHDFGFNKMRNFVIDTPQKLKFKLEMVEALGEIEVATKLLNGDDAEEDPLFYQYSRLRCQLTPLVADSEEFSMVSRYMKNTHAKTHSGYSVEIQQVFLIQREGEAERFSKFSGTNNRMLLWHGSRLTNWTGILSEGLRIAPPEAPVTGYMFGKGVYFADMFSKSANYCHASPDAVLLLCEVALGDMAEFFDANHNADQLPRGKLSTKGVGGSAPDVTEALILEDGLVVPLGRAKEGEQGKEGSLLYNEYIVYNVEQIKMRYLLHLTFHFAESNK